MLKELHIFPVLQTCLERFVELRASQLVREVVLCQVGLVLHYVLLLDGPEAALADVLCPHDSLGEAVQLRGRLNLSEEDESIHYRLDLVFLLCRAAHFFFEDFDQVVLLEGRAFLDLSLLPHLFLLLSVGIALRELACLGEATRRLAA